MRPEIEQAINEHFPGNQGLREVIWETIARGGRAVDIKDLIGFSRLRERDQNTKKLQLIDIVVNQTMDREL